MGSYFATSEKNIGGIALRRLMIFLVFTSLVIFATSAIAFAENGPILPPMFC